MDFGKKLKKKKTTGRTKVLVCLAVLFMVLIITILITLYIQGTIRQVNIILVGENIAVLKVDGVNKTASALMIPDKAYIDTAYGKGQILASSLGKYDQHFSNNLMQATVSEYLGIPIDAYVKAAGYPLVTEGDIRKIVSIDFSLLNFRNSSFPFITYLAVSRLISNVRPDKFTMIDIGGSGIYDNSILADGSDVLVADNLKLDNILFEKFNETSILKENLTVAVLNGSKTARIATRAARIMSNMGVNVVNVGESQDRYVKCEILSNNKSKSYTLLRLKQIFGCEIKYNALANERADLVVILGDDYANRLFGNL